MQRKQKRKQRKTNTHLRCLELLQRISLDAFAAALVFVLQQLEPGLDGGRGHGQRPNDKAVVRFLIPLTLQHFSFESPGARTLQPRAAIVQHMPVGVHTCR